MTKPAARVDVGSDTFAIIEPQRLRRGIAALFSAAGLPGEPARLVANALVDADLSGAASHGVMLVPMYLERIRHGSVSLETTGEIVQDCGNTLVIDGRHALGQLTSQQAVDLLAERARSHGISIVVVRDAFHFGAAGYWADQLARKGFVGIVASNTRPLMPAPGGAERVVGNNPLAIAVPSDGEIPIMVDMALSASAMGKIRLAQSRGETLPDGWATDAQGQPTTDPLSAISGMLLPAGGAKGFGLAFMLDLLCGGLSGGAIGSEVKRLYDNAAQPYGCAHFFMAIDVQRFLPLDRFNQRVSQYAAFVRNSKKADGIERLFSPGERAWNTRQRNTEKCVLSLTTIQALCASADLVGLGAGIFSENYFEGKLSWL